MKDEKVALYESLIRASLILIFIVALSMGTFGLVAISQMLMRHAVANATFANTDTIASETGY